MSRSLVRSLLVAGVAASAVTLNVLPASAVPVGFTVDQESGQLASIDAGTATVSDIGGTNWNIDSLALACDDVLFGTAVIQQAAGVGLAVQDSDQLVTINTTTGVSTLVGDLGLTEREYGLAFAPDGTLYLSNHDQLFTVSTTTGATTLIGSSGDDASDMRSLAFDAAGTLYGYDDNSGRLYTINTTTAAVTEVGNAGSSVGDMTGLDFDSSGTLWGIANPDGTALVTFDLETGQGDYMGAVDARGLALTALPCPTPPSTTTTSTSTTSTTSIPGTTSTTAAPTAAAAAVVVQPRFTG